MADRRPISSRLWSLATSLTPRRNAATRSSENTTSSPTPPPKVEPQNNSQSTATATNATSTNPPVAEIETQTSRSTKTTTAASRPPTASAQATTPPSSEAELQTNSQSTVSNTTTTSTDPSIMEIKIPTSPSTTTTTTRPPIVVAQPPTPPSGEVLTDGPNTNTTIDTSQNPPKVETQTSAGQSNTTPTPTPPAFIPPPTIPPSTVVQTANQSTFNASARPTGEPEPKPQTTSQYRATTQSPSSSKPASPSSRTTQSKPLSQPSSPSRAAPQARFTPSSPSRAGFQIPLTPQRPSQPRSPSRLASNSPKQRSPTSTKGTQPTSPSKESLSTNQEISNVDEAPVELASNEKEPKTAASQEEALETQPKEDVKSDNNDERTPLVESNAKPEETKEVKEVVQAANTETNKETNKEANDFLASKSGSRAQIIEKVEHLSKPDEKQDALDTKEILPISLPNVKPNSQPKKITMISDTYKKSALPSGENVPLHKEIKEHISPFVNKIAIGDPKLAIYEKRAGVITLAGENRGALMEVGSNSSKREEPVHIHRGYKTNPDESTEATTDEEESSKGKKSDDGRATKDQPTEAYLNNNAQGINNSIVFNTSVAERNPGIHMVVNHVQKELIELTDKSRGVETRKAEFNISHAEKLTYEPTVRRRCLKGLFLETSDSDQENSEKPRRHGCRVGCKEKDKEKNIDVL
ncbi:hypothetical protein BUALT_Bualt08G0072600 [Buddleja alternifolia]|uniref:Uncharacterized protein n=1 Tax=Buddleja alternifolia TaxID=168488 RepID=A0AAV6XBN5_9LAMI|nr:hypothetical protein BUALT_Bualt08G0072600 [Buddleja alternifolia]